MWSISLTRHTNPTGYKQSDILNEGGTTSRPVLHIKYLKLAPNGVVIGSPFFVDYLMVPQRQSTSTLATPDQNVPVRPQDLRNFTFKLEGRSDKTQIVVQFTTNIKTRQATGTFTDELLPGSKEGYPDFEPVKLHFTASLSAMEGNIEYIVLSHIRFAEGISNLPLRLYNDKVEGIRWQVIRSHPANPTGFRTNDVLDNGSTYRDVLAIPYYASEAAAAENSVDLLQLLAANVTPLPTAIPTRSPSPFGDELWQKPLSYMSSNRGPTPSPSPSPSVRAEKQEITFRLDDSKFQTVIHFTYEGNPIWMLGDPSIRPATGTYEIHVLPELQKKYPDSRPIKLRFTADLVKQVGEGGLSIDVYIHNINFLDDVSKLLPIAFYKEEDPFYGAKEKDGLVWWFKPIMANSTGYHKSDILGEAPESCVNSGRCIARHVLTIKYIDTRPSKDIKFGDEYKKPEPYAGNYLAAP
jgi:hypothetical protein